MGELDNLVNTSVITIILERTNKGLLLTIDLSIELLGFVVLFIDQWYGQTNRVNEN